MGMEKTKYLGTLFWREDDFFYEQTTEGYIAKIVEIMEAHTHAVVSTPGGNSNAGEVNLEPLGSIQHDIYRKAIGVIQWIAPCRPDIYIYILIILYALKELGRQLAAPRQTDWQSLRQLNKYLETTEHYRLKLSVGEDNHMLRCYTDSIWCGCQETRKSTGCAMVFCGNLLNHA
eukprot:4418720-Amphidinium_carterae.1